MAFDFKLRDFVVKLVTSQETRDRFMNAEQRDAVMTEANLSPDAKKALTDSNEGVLRSLLNQQVSTATARKIVDAADAKVKGKPAPKPAAKGGQKKGGKKKGGKQR
jgi:hypothetical protein